jgi:hypothetical protein
MLQLTLGPTVGVAPGTTTLCQRGVNGLGICPPGHYGPAVMLPGSAPAPGSTSSAPTVATYYNPYANETALKGLRGLTSLRWDLFALMLGLGFAAVLGYSYYRRKH